MTHTPRAKFSVGQRVVYVVYGLHITGVVHSRAYSTYLGHWVYEVDSLESFARGERYEEDLTEG